MKKVPFERLKKIKERIGEKIKKKKIEKKTRKKLKKKIAFKINQEVRDDRTIHHDDDSFKDTGKNSNI